MGLKKEGVTDGCYYLFCAGFYNFLYLCVCVGVQLITVETRFAASCTIRPVQLMMTGEKGEI